jgi:hypothetical protein
MKRWRDGFLSQRGRGLPATHGARRGASVEAGQQDRRAPPRRHRPGWPGRSPAFEGIVQSGWAHINSIRI